MLQEYPEHFLPAFTWARLWGSGSKLGQRVWSKGSELELCQQSRLESRADGWVDGLGGLFQLWWFWEGGEDPGG